MIIMRCWQIITEGLLVSFPFQAESGTAKTAGTILIRTGKILIAGKDSSTAQAIANKGDRLKPAGQN
jgi:hypothetical protein